jgi:hypothetical protein
MRGGVGFGNVDHFHVYAHMELSGRKWRHVWTQEIGEFDLTESSGPSIDDTEQILERAIFRNRVCCAKLCST